MSAPTHAIRCNIGCIPAPDMFKNIYAVTKNSEGIKLSEILRAYQPPDPTTTAAGGAGSKESQGIVIAVVIAIFCFVCIVIGGIVYWFQDDIFGKEEPKK